MNDILIKKTTDFFRKTFNSDADKVVLSPGRINIIGEHIDYNDGYVLPAAIDKICRPEQGSKRNPVDGFHQRNGIILPHIFFYLPDLRYPFLYDITMFFYT